MNPFNYSAKFYDLLYEHKAYQKEANYVRNLLSTYGNGKSVLELGCGSGAHAVYLAEGGSTITGVDMSADMLLRMADRAGRVPEKIRRRLSWHQGDIRTFRSEFVYDSVISLFHVMSYMTTNRDLDAAFATASSGLVAGGVFVFDCWYGPAVLMLKPEQRETTKENASLLIVRKVTPVHRPNDNVVEVHYDYTVRRKDTGDTVHYTEVHPMRYMFQPEVELFLDNNGFDLVAAEEFLTGDELSGESWTACFVARKRY